MLLLSLLPLFSQPRDALSLQVGFHVANNLYYLMSQSNFPSDGFIFSFTSFFAAQRRLKSTGRFSINSRNRLKLSFRNTSHLGITYKENWMIKRRGGELVQLHFKTQKTIWSDVKNLENRIHALPERNSFSDTQLVRSHSIQFKPLLAWWTLFYILFMMWFRRGDCKSAAKSVVCKKWVYNVHSAEKILDFRLFKKVY